MQAQVEMSEARIGDVYEDTTGSALGDNFEYGKGARWKLVGLGCDGMFVGESNGMRKRMVSYRGRYRRVEKGTGEKIKGYWEFHTGNYSLPLVCPHGQKVQDGIAEVKPHCLGCVTHLRLKSEAETRKAGEYRAEARQLWQTCYS